MEGGDTHQFYNIPNVGQKMNLDHSYPEIRNPFFVPSLKIIRNMLPLILRYLIFYIKCIFWRLPIVMDYVKPQVAKCIYGVPIGGIGSGSIGRGFKGEFCRFQLKPAECEYNTIDANQFIVTIKDENGMTIFQSLLSTFKRTKLKSWKSLLDGSKCTYTGLYPRSWTTFDLSEYGIKLTLRQISPIIPNDYENSCLPLALFVWKVESVSDAVRTVTVAFTFKNGTGNEKEDGKAVCSTERIQFDHSQGIILRHTINDMECDYALVTDLPKNTFKYSCCMYFDPNSNGDEPWYQLKSHGSFTSKNLTRIPSFVGECACAIATQLQNMEPNSCEEIRMVLAWHMPQIRFTSDGLKYDKYYSQYGSNVVDLCERALSQGQIWETKIANWQRPILEDENLPDWYKGALFNELSYISDGGSLWLQLADAEMDNLSANDPRKIYGRFAYLEGREYKMYNTYDVHFYSSYALCRLFPQLQEIIQYDIRDAIYEEIPNKRKMWYDGRMVERKCINTVPHDLGGIGEPLITHMNSYPVLDVSQWKDLGCKFVLQVLRDSNTVFKNDTYLNDMFGACIVLMKKLEYFDTDGDGLIENNGQPDQTYDSWQMQGPSAYCGGLWIASVFAMTEMAKKLNRKMEWVYYSNLLAKAKQAFHEVLWNGHYYNFDTSNENGAVIMADQLCAYWYLRCAGYTNEVFPKNEVISCLKTIYENNVCEFASGNLGAVNGYRDGAIDDSSVQSQEVWTGVTYALAATMIFENMKLEGFRTAGGMFHYMSEKCGLLFDTPEALYEHNHYRSIGYMRPLSIWTMQAAIETTKTLSNKICE